MPVGPSPFSPDFSEWYLKKRHSKNKRETKGLLTDYETRKLRSSLTGDTYMMPKQDYDELVKHFKEHHSEISEMYGKDGKQRYGKIQTPADYIDYAFEKKSQQRNIVQQDCNGGHIKSISYNALYMLLMVEFTNRGDICVFFNLPANVAAQLLHYAKTGETTVQTRDGKQRHMVGVTFWNLVRVRGTLHDTRYPFQYTTDNRPENGVSGRRPGTGATGREAQNKYEYVTAPRQRKRYDRETGEEITRDVQVRARRRDDIFNSAVANKAAANYNVMEYTIDDFIDYFEEANKSWYDKHMRMAAGNVKKNIETAKKLVDNFDGSEDTLDRIARLLRSTGFDFPEANPEYTE